MTALLSVSHLSVRYGDLVGVADVSLEVPQGGVVALLGSNGAGKTTTLNAIAGLVPPAGGRVLWQGESIGGLRAFAIVRRGLALSPEGWRLFVQQTVEQNLRLGATVLGDRRRVPELLERVFALFPRLKERRRQRAGTLSGGERQMLAMGRALMSEPKLLMLDEPSLGLAPAVVEAMYERLRAVAPARDDAAACGTIRRAGARSGRLRLRAANRPHDARRTGAGSGERPGRAAGLSWVGDGRARRVGPCEFDSRPDALELRYRKTDSRSAR